jgi:glycosyltransferase involved in cell wall biosynthesis
MVFLRVVIPTKNEESYLSKLITSIKKQNFKNLEIVVADAYSTDNTRSIARHYGCKIVDGGYADVGRNNGAKNCNAEMLCFIDSDIILPDSDFLKKSLKEFEKRKLDLAGTLQVPVRINKKMKDLIYKMFYGISNKALYSFQNSNRPFMQQLMFVKTDVYQDVGGFPPYEFGEDSAFAKFAVEKGYKFGILISPGKALVHPRRFEKNGFFNMLIKYAYFNGMIILGHKFERGKTKLKYW